MKEYEQGTSIEFTYQVGGEEFTHVMPVTDIERLPFPERCWSEKMQNQLVDEKCEFTYDDIDKVPGEYLMDIKKYILRHHDLQHPNTDFTPIVVSEEDMDTYLSVSRLFTTNVTQTTCDLLTQLEKINRSKLAQLNYDKLVRLVRAKHITARWHAD